MQELKKMLGWLESNSKNRKTQNGIKSFITRWLSKCQDKAPRVAQNESLENPPFRMAFESDEEYDSRLRAVGWKLVDGIPNKLNGGFEEI